MLSASDKLVKYIIAPACAGWTASIWIFAIGLHLTSSWFMLSLCLDIIGLVLWFVNLLCRTYIRYQANKVEVAMTEMGLGQRPRP